MNVSTVAQMRSMDKAAIEQYGIPEEILMENAGHAAIRALSDMLAISGRSILILCGTGNNGGDGLVVARLVHALGGFPKLVHMGDPANYGGAAKTNYEIVRKLGLHAQRLKAAAQLEEYMEDADAIVDALLGTGITRAVEGLYADVIKIVNGSGKPVLSIDIASGIHGDTGSALGSVVRANCTVTFGLPKLGNLLYPGYEMCGRLVVSHISFPPQMYDSDSLTVFTNDPVQLPARQISGHKGKFGDALFISGARSYYGAPYFAAMSFMKAGGGYARLAAPGSIVPTIAGKGSEIVFVPQVETPEGSIALANADDLLKLIKRLDFVVLGPGLSLQDETQKLVRTLTEVIDKPLLLDGDGITAVCGSAGLVRQRQAPTILTPHLGEMSRLAGLSVSEIEANRVDVLRQVSASLNAIVVLKGAHSLIGYPDGRVSINLSGNSGMATAGSGDVLTGTIAAMTGIGLPIEAAVRQGVFVHGLAGDLAAETEGQDGMTAQSILEHVGLAVKQCRVDRRALLGRYALPVVV